MRKEDLIRITSALAVTFGSGAVGNAVRPVSAQEREAIYSKVTENGLPPALEIFFTREKIVLREQEHRLTCELASARMVAEWFYRRYHKKLPRIESCQNLEDFFRINTPLSDNPFKGFRGDYDGMASVELGTEQGYGVYPPPIAKNLERLGIPARVIIWQVNEESAEKLKQLMEESFREDRTWLVWLAPEGQIFYETDRQTKEKYPLVLGEHCVAMQVQEGEFGQYAEIFDPHGYSYSADFDYLLGEMGNLGLLMAIRVG